MRALTVRRVGSPQLVASEEKKIGTGVRHAFCLGRGETLRITGPGLSRGRLLFSVGAGEASTTYALHAMVAGTSRLLQRRTLASQEPGWVDQELVLAPAVAMAEEFRFTAHATDPNARTCVGGILFTASDSTPGNLPNVILVSLDTLGADYLGPGEDGASLTPHLDRLRRESFVFDRTFAQYPSTLASHSSLFTGLYPVHHGRYGHDPKPFSSLVERFRDAGYLAVGITENAFVGSSLGFARAFDEYDDGSSKALGDAPGTFARATEWVARRGREERFFLFVHTYEVHEPYRPRDAAGLARANALTPADTRVWDDKEQYRMMRSHPTIAKLSGKDLNRLEALHRGEIDYLDRALAGFLSGLAELGADENTLLIIFSDHGDEFLEDGPLGHGLSLSNRVIHVPLYFRWPKRLAPGASDEPVEVADILPTILELAGLGKPAGIDGASLVPLMNAAAASADTAYAELVFDQAECRVRGRSVAPCRVESQTLQDARWKFYRRRVVGHPWSEKLYHLATDPGETTNVAATHPAEVLRLRTELNRKTAPLADQSASSTAVSVVDQMTRQRLEALGYVE